MIIPPSNNNLLTLITPSLKAVSLRIGDIVRANVIEIMDSGNVSLRINTGDNSFAIMARSPFSLSKNDTLFLKVLGGHGEINLKLIKIIKDAGIIKEGDVPAWIRNILSGLLRSRLRVEDLVGFREFFKSMPEGIKALIPELNSITKLIPEIESLDHSTLKESIENSGVLLETKIRLLSKGEIKDIWQIMPSDLKGLILKVRHKLNDPEVLNMILSSGYKRGDIDNIINSLIRNIEFFQLVSNMNNIFYTFVPVSWLQLKDGEILFRKGKGDNENAYECEIRLDIDKIGRLSVHITLYNNSLFITFNAENAETVSLLISNKDALQQRFLEIGLSIKAININQRDLINFGSTEKMDIDIRV